MHPIITTHIARIFQRHTLSTSLITMVIMELHHTCTQVSQATHTCMGHHHHTHVTALPPLYTQQDQVHQSIPWKKGTVNGLGMVNLNLENLKKAITTEHLHAEIKVTKAQTAQ